MLSVLLRETKKRIVTRLRSQVSRSKPKSTQIGKDMEPLDRCIENIWYNLERKQDDSTALLEEDRAKEVDGKR
jgi:hypothetical protein